jgi:hypothetical protein
MPLGECLGIRVEDVIGETGEPDFQLVVFLHAFECFARGDLRGVAQRIAVCAATDRRKCDAAKLMGAGQLETMAVTRREQFAFAICAAVPNRTHCVDNVFCGQAVAARDFRVAGRATAQRAALREQLRPGRAMDRAIDSTTAEQRGVGRIHNRVDLELRDVSAREVDALANARVDHA